MNSNLTTVPATSASASTSTSASARACFRPRAAGCSRLRAAAGLLCTLAMLWTSSLSAQPVIYLEPESVAPPGGGEGYLGLEVALNATHLALAAPWRTVAGQRQSGVVEILSSDGTALFTLENPNPEVASYFGNAVALNDDLLAVGASHADATGTNSGVVYLFDMAGQQVGGPVQNPGDSAFFGREVILRPGGELIVAATGSPGAIYRFDPQGAEAVTSVANPDPASLPFFGTSMAVTPQGDLLTTGLAGWSPGGAVYRFSHAGELLSSTPFLDALALYVASSDSGEALVGVLASDGTGAAHRYFSDGQLAATYFAPAGVVGRFGTSVAQLGGSVAVGAPTGGGGEVFLFDAATGKPTRSFSASDPVTGAEFGRELSVRGDGLLIGAPATDPSFAGQPSAHLLVPAKMLCNRPIEDFDQVLLGTDGDDSLDGGRGDDLIVLFAGDDRAQGRQGDDCILGGPGADRLDGNQGFDHLDGGGSMQDHCRSGEIYENCEI